MRRLNISRILSPTEEIALTAGTTWIDKQLFTGEFQLKNILSEPYSNQLNKEEQKFIDTKVTELCSMVDEWETVQNRDFTPEVWEFMKKEKFFSLIIPRQYGGLGFSASANSKIVSILATHSQALAITVMVPNSLGPAELLIKYGTKKQKDYYLPRLSVGEEIPCFGLTEPLAGSDATSLRAEGIIFKNEDGELLIRLNWEKRYITLSAISTLIGLAFNLKDPDRLLGVQEEIGITCALIKSDKQGVKLESRHDPLSVPFVNAPIFGEDVVIKLEDVIGAEKGLGRGWQMLMECLSVGRGISLPAISIGGWRFLGRYTTHYTKIRQQFSTDLYKFQGVQEPLYELFTNYYMIEAARVFTSSAIDNKQKPSVINAIIKYHSTEKLRQSLNHSMDILAGKGIIRGPKNPINSIYNGTPIGITVEGANILTRSLMQFGQGIMRCHPFLYKELKSLQNKNLKEFDKNLFAHISFSLSTFSRYCFFSLTKGLTIKASSKGFFRSYEKKLHWASVSFAFYTELMLLFHSSKLKTMEFLNGCFGDILSNLYLATASMRKYQADNFPIEDKPLLEAVLNKLLDEIQESFQNLFKNFSGSRIFSFIFHRIASFHKIFSFSHKKTYHRDKEKLIKSFMGDPDRIAKFFGEVYSNPDGDDVLQEMKNVHHLSLSLSELNDRIKVKLKKRKLPKNLGLEKMKKEQIISEKEYEKLRAYQLRAYELISVDSFPIEQYFEQR